MVGFLLSPLSLLSVHLEVASIRTEARGQSSLEAGDGGSRDLESQGNANQKDNEGGDDGGRVVGSAVLTVEKGETGDEQMTHNNVASLPVSS